MSLSAVQHKPCLIFCATVSGFFLVKQLTCIGLEQFATHGANTLDPPAQNGFELAIVEQANLPTTTGVTIAPTYLARTVLPRVLSALAVNADFSTERISDVQMFADALVAQATKESQDENESHKRDHVSTSSF